MHDQPAHPDYFMWNVDQESAAEALRIRDRAINAAGCGILISEMTPVGLRHIYANDCFRRITGYSAEDILGETFGFLETHRDDQHLIGAIQEAIRDGRPFETIKRNYRKDGTLFWNELTLAPIHDSGGELTHFVSSITDNSQLMEAKQRLQWSETSLLDAQRVAKVGSWDWDLVTNKFMRSAELWHLLGLDPANSSGSLQDFFSVVHPADRDHIEATVRAAVEARASYDVTFRVIGHQDGERYIRSRADVSYDDAGKVIRMFGTGLDITDLKMAELELERTLDELQRSNNELEQFAYVASHDLQEPLRKIQMFGDRLKQKYSAELSPDGQDCVDRMFRGAQRMRMLIDDLLAFSRVTTGKMEFEKINLADAVAEAVSNLEIAISESGATVAVGDLPQVHAVPSQMIHLFQNLIGNAIKFRKPGKAPYITVQAVTFDGALSQTTAAEVAGKCQIAVSDDGIGFEPEFGRKIFELFQRLHGRSEYEGTGLGLAICRRIVEKHRGTIMAESAPDRGATFRVWLPWRQLQEDQQEAA